MENNARFYAENRERERERAQGWRLQNPERCKATTEAWRKENKEAFAETKRLWRENNKEHVVQSRKEHYENNKKRLLATAREYKEANRERLNAAVAQWYRDHPEVNRLNASRHRARKIQAMPSWADQDKIKAIYDEAVRLTLVTGIRHEVDHIYPLQSKWMCGLHVETNLQILTIYENRSKKNKIPARIEHGGIESISLAA
jgi:hypothetical protein